MITELGKQIHHLKRCKPLMSDNEILKNLIFLNQQIHTNVYFAII